MRSEVCAQHMLAVKRSFMPVKLANPESTGLSQACTAQCIHVF